MRHNRPWKILTHEFLPFRGGVATYWAELSAALARLGEEVEIWSPGHPVAPDPAVAVRKMGGKMSPGQLHLWLWGWALWRQRQALAKSRVILGSYGAIRIGLELSRWNWVEASSVYPLFHGSEIPRLTGSPELRRRTQAWLKACPQLLAASPHAARLLVSSGLVNDSSRITVAPCALPEAFRRTSLPQAEDPGQGEFRILTLARVHPRKGQRDIALALGLLPPALKSRVLYQLAGPAQADYLPEVARACREGGVRFVHLGAIPAENLAATYAQAHLHALTSRTLPNSVEGFGLVYLEAAACGLTSVASDSGGCVDAVLDQETGWVVKEGDIAALAEVFSRLMTDDTLRNRLAAQARRRALGHTWDDSARALLDRVP